MKNLLFLITLFIIGCSSGDKKFVVYEKNGHGLVAATEDLGIMDWYSAKDACENLVLNGYDDWYLPSKEELNQLYLNKGKIGGFANSIYWSSTEYNTNDIKPNPAWVQYFNDNGTPTNFNRKNKFSVRAVRAF